MKVLHIAHYPKSGIISVIRSLIMNSRHEEIEYSLLVLEGEDLRLKHQLKTFAEYVTFLDMKNYMFFQTLNRFYHMISRIRPDIVHIHSYLPLCFYSILCQITTNIKSKVVITKHNDYPYFYSNDLKSLFKRYSERYCIKHYCHLVIFNCDKVKESVRSLYQLPINKSLRIYNGMNLEVFKDRKYYPKAGKINVISVGNLNEQKNYSFLLFCWKEIVNKFPNSSLSIVGDGHFKKALISQSIKLGIDKSVRFLGWRNDVIELLRNSDIFILTSIYESFPTVILEAFSQSLPVIATEVGGVPEMINDGVNGLLLPVNGKGQTVAAIKELIQRPALMEKYGKAGLKTYKDKFTISRYISESENMYNTLLSKKNCF